jgi:hypothetical protein
VEVSLLHLFSVCAINAFEFDMAVETLKSYKSFDQITAQVIQSGDEPVHSELSNLFISIWNKEELLQQKKRNSVIVPLYEKGNKRICNNCRGLEVFEERVLRKIF